MQLKISFALWLGYSLCLSNLLVAQTVTQAKFSADSLLSSGEYKAAYALYHRIWYFANESEKLPLLEKLAVCAEGTGDYADAYSLYGGLGRLVDDSSSVTILQQQVSAGLKAGYYEESSLLLMKLEPTTLSVQQKLRMSLYFGLSKLMLHQKEAADSGFRTFLPYLSNEDSVGLVKLLKDYNKKAVVNRRRVETLSLVFPGTGQFYMGKVTSGINSLAINALLVSGMVFTSIEYGIVSGTLFWMPAVGHYYIGGANAALELATQKQKSIDQYYYNAFVRLITKARFKEAVVTAE